MVKITRLWMRKLGTESIQLSILEPKAPTTDAG